jgi:hypothetical protein
MILNMFRASLCSSSGGQLYVYSIWYRHTLYGNIQSATIPGTVYIYIYRRFTVFYLHSRKLVEGFGLT